MVRCLDFLREKLVPGDCLPFDEVFLFPAFVSYTTQRFVFDHFHPDKHQYTDHKGAFLTIFIRISTDKQNTWIFGKFSAQLDEIVRIFGDIWS